MRSIIAAFSAAEFLLTAGTPPVAAQARMSPQDNNYHALHGLMTMYAAGMVCYYNKWSFSKQDTDEMMVKIKELTPGVSRKTSDDMWAQAREIMAEGKASASQERCAQVRQRYADGRPFLLKVQPAVPEKAAQ